MSTELVPPAGHDGLEREMTSALPGTLTETGYRLPPDLGYDEWERVGAVLLAMGRSAMWWIGDWIRYGEEAFGEKYAQALELTGYEYQTLRNAVWTAEHVQESERRPELSFSYHQEVAAIESPAAQRDLLAQTVEAGWSRSDLRQAARKVRKGLEPGQAAIEVEAAKEGPQEGEQDGPQPPGVDSIPHFIAGVLSGFEPFTNQHPEERLSLAYAILAALNAQGYSITKVE